MTAQDVRELRLALVCYGGVSLAIYMHGVAKEIQKLVVASTAYDADQQNSPFPKQSTEHAWWTLLDGQARRDGVRTKVIVDIISGTSAGGINGVCLAKALATNRSQEGLTKIWMERGDIGMLARGPRWIPVAGRAALFGLDFASRPGFAAPPLRGDIMSAWLLEAFEDMSNGQEVLEGVPSLVPDGQSLDLFVPITDFAGRNQELPVDSPRWMTDRTHRHLMTFRHEGHQGTAGGRQQFDRDHDAMLAFAARATSSFPGGFPPISLEAFRKTVGDKGNKGGKVGFEEQLHDFFSLYSLQGVDINDTWFVDGGVLDNAPFGSSIAAISSKPAGRQVDRRLVYIEPDPTVVTAEESTPRKMLAPSWPKTIWGGIAGIPRHEPIVDELLGVAKRNRDVSRVRDVIETSFEAVSVRVRELAAQTVGSGEMSGLTVDQLDATLAQARTAAASEAGFGYMTYARLRIRSMVDGFASLMNHAADFPPGSFHATFVEEVLQSWAQNAGLFDRTTGIDLERSALIERVDLGYHERHLRFVIAALSWWYRGGEGAPTRSQLDEGKERLYEHVQALRALGADLVDCPTVVEAMKTVFDPGTIHQTLDQQTPPADITARHGQLLTSMYEEICAQVDGGALQIRQRAHADVLSMCSTWPAAAREDFLVRYLGFPFWDVLTFPVQALSGVNERDAVEVARISPQDVTLLEASTAARKNTNGSNKKSKKLKGAGFHHFGAFFSREGREGDYLWGRLDTVERLVALVTDEAERPGLATPEASSCVPLFNAVLDEEADRLTRIDSLVADVRGRVARLS